MRSLLISLLVVLLAAAIQAVVFKKEKVKLGKKNCLCDFNIEIGDTCSGSAKCDKKCSGSGTVELGGCSFTLAVKKGKGKISKCSCEAATVPVPTEPTIGPGSGETPVPMTGSGSGETPVPMPTSPGSGSGGEGMQCSCKCNCPDGSGECDCDCNCPMTSKAVTCAPGFSAVCPMMGDMCPQDMDPICPHNAISRMGGNAAEGMDKGCQCVPDFLLAMVMIQPTGRMEAVDRAMTKATIQVGKKKCKCSYEMNAENCKKSKIVCDKKCSGKESGVELADGDVMYMVDIAVKKGKVTIAKCDVEAPEPTGTGGGSTGSGSGNGEGGMGGMVSRCACVSKGMGGSGPTVPTLPPTGSGSEPAPPTGSGSEPAPPTGSGSEPAPPTGSGSEPAPPTGSGSGSDQKTKSTSTTAPNENTCNLKCGIKNTGKRVVGGANSQVNEYPWMVALYNRGKSLPSCGGTLLNSRWIVTAGHCHDGSFPLDVAVLGEHDVTVETETMLKIERNIVYKLRHEAYDSNTLKNDIALFKMDAPVDTNVYLPACLPPHGADYQGETAWVTGWGTISEGGQQASVLQELELSIVDDKTCYDAMTGALGTYWGQTFADEQVCAGGEAGKDGCQGDSGGPFVHDRDGVFELIGVVSWGLGCARQGVYGIYSEVDHYLPWIASSISNNENMEVTVDIISCV